MDKDESDEDESDEDEFNEDEFIKKLKTEFDCSHRTAEKIANKAEKYHMERNTDKSIDDWISMMQDSGQPTVKRKWGWAVGYATFGDAEKYKL